MKRSSFLWVAAASLLLGTALDAATRPRYGGVLRVETRHPLESLDPALPLASLPLAQARDRIALLVFDCLVRLDGNGLPRPHLASSWQHDDGHRRWQFWLRRGAQLHDGAPLTAELVAESLAASNPAWTVRPVGDSVVVEATAPSPGLHLELARAANAVVVRHPSGLLGTGPFRVREFQPGRRAVLAAHEEHWGGRPYLDEVRIEMQRSLRDQLISLQLGRAEVIEVAPDEVTRTRERGQRVMVSEPAELMVLVWRRESPPQEAALREALALAVDRASIQQVLLQGHGEAGSGLLPQWISGYAFLLPGERDLARARSLRAARMEDRTLVLSFEPGDRLAQAVAERVAVNAREVGLRLHAVMGARSSDVRLLRVPLETSAGPLALSAAAAALGDPVALHPASAEQSFAAESALLSDFRIIPLAHLPEAYGIAEQVRNWRQPRLGGWPLEDLWLSAPPPAGAAP